MFVTSLKFYAIDCDEFVNNNMVSLEWRHMAEFEAIMRKAHQLYFDAQGNRSEVAAEIISLLSLLKMMTSLRSYA